MRLIEVKERPRVFEEQARIQSSESDAREEEVLANYFCAQKEWERKSWHCEGIKGHPTPSDAISCGVYIIHVKREVRCEFGEMDQKGDSALWLAICSSVISPLLHP
ncbi:unnamed protein product [Porites evermanni]|uniref:Uncharacterized protein n=1 Tax=Porites evermanni TaxID=104178 RepID=A0ABN8PRI2_9CNID|nr:unnamed protein product [Porites evermanni]